MVMSLKKKCGTNVSTHDSKNNAPVNEHLGKGKAGVITFDKEKKILSEYSPPIPAVSLSETQRGQKPPRGPSMPPS